MPDYFSHSICAQIILENCDKEIKERVSDRTLYLLGAQGGDVFFAYKLSFYQSNLGRRIHSMPAERLFNLLCGANDSYVAGFATHYALDCMLHPIIYAFERGSKKPLAHLRFENDLGLFISKKYSVPRKILPYERIMGTTFTVYDALARVQPLITLTGVERCLKRHFSYTRTLLRTKKQTYTFPYDYSSLSGAVDDAVSFGCECVKSVISGNISPELFSRSFLER